VVPKAIPEAKPVLFDRSTEVSKKSRWLCLSGFVDPLSDKTVAAYLQRADKVEVKG